MAVASFLAAGTVFVGALEQRAGAVVVSGRTFPSEMVSGCGRSVFGPYWPPPPAPYSLFCDAASFNISGDASRPHAVDLASALSSPCPWACWVTLAPNQPGQQAPVVLDPNQTAHGSTIMFPGEGVATFWIQVPCTVVSNVNVCAPMPTFDVTIVVTDEGALTLEAP